MKIKTEGVGENRAVFGAAMLTVSALVTKILGLLYKMPLATVIGDEGMGYLSAALTVAGFFFLIFSTGLPKGVAILFSSFGARGREDDKRRLLTVAVRLAVFGGGIASTLIALFADEIAAAVGARDAAMAIICISPTPLLFALGGVYRGALTGEEDHLPVAVSGAVEGGAKLVLGLSFALLCVGGKVRLPICAAAVSAATSLAALLSVVLLILSYKKRKTKIKMGQNKEKSTRRQLRKQLFSLAFPLSSAAILGGGVALCDLVFVMRGLLARGVSESAATALYGNFTSLALPAFGLVAATVSPICQAALPRFSRYLTAGEEERAKESLCAVTRSVGFLAAPLSVGLSVFGFEALSLFFRDSSAITAANALVILAPSGLFLAPLTVLNTYAEASGKVRLPALSLAVGSIVKAVSCYPLVLALGIAGASLSTALAYFSSFVLTVAALPKEAKCLSGLAAPTLFALGAAALATLSSAALDGLPEPLFTPILGILYLVFYVALCFLWSVNPKNRSKSGALLPKKRKSVY